MAFIYNLSDTWNDGAVTFTGIGLNVTDSASNANSLLMDLQVGGASRFSVTKTGICTSTVAASSTNAFSTNGRVSGIGGVFGGSNAVLLDSVFLAASHSVQWSSTSSWAGTKDLFILRDAANTLALRNGVNAQAFNIYNTFTDASNFERMNVSWNTNVAVFALANSGTGSARGAFRFLAGNTSADFQIASTTDTNAAVNFRHSASESGVGSSVSYVGRISGHRGFFDGAGAVTLAIPSGATDRWAFFGTTSAFPALKRNGTALETKLADDSAFAPHAMQYLDVTDGVTAPSAATGRARIYVDTADGDLKVVFADGTVKTIVTDT